MNHSPSKFSTRQSHRCNIPNQPIDFIQSTLCKNKEDDCPESSPLEDCQERRLGVLQDFLADMTSQRVTIKVLQAMLFLHSARERETNIKDLAGYMGSSSAAMTHVVDCLEYHGFAKRVPNGIDRRRMDIVITSNGSAFIGNIAKSLRALAVV